VGHFVSFFAECARRHSAKVASLPSARAVALSKEDLPVPRCFFFAECYDIDTQQNTSWLSVTLNKVTSIPLFICFCYSLQINKRYITYTSQISRNHRIHNRDHIFHKFNNFFYKHVYVHTKFHQHKYYQLKHKFIQVHQHKYHN
jgi:hypothetical protein